MQIRVEITSEAINHPQSKGANTIFMALKAAIDRYFGCNCIVNYPITEEDGRVIDETVRILVPESKGILKIWHASVPAKVDDIYQSWVLGTQPGPFEFDLVFQPQ